MKNRSLFIGRVSQGTKNENNLNDKRNVFLIQQNKIEFTASFTDIALVNEQLELNLSSVKFLLLFLIDASLVRAKPPHDAFKSFVFDDIFRQNLPQNEEEKVSLII